MTNLPSFKSHNIFHREKKYNGASTLPPDNFSPSSSRTGDGTTDYKPPAAPTMSRLRKWLLLLSMLLLLISIVFTILVLIAQINPSVLPSTFFIKIDLTHIFVPSVSGLSGDLPFLNSVARSIGLHDYYQVGLWTWCSGYNSENGGRPTSCSEPVDMYWFNPVDILLGELLAGATIQLPGDIVNILDLIKLASNVMFGLFLGGISLTALYLLVLPLSLLKSENLRPKTRSCWTGFLIGTIGFLAALLSVAATTVATVMFSIMKNVLQSQPELNIGADIGKSMLAFMWIGSGSVLLAWLVQWRCGCCFRKVKRESRQRKIRRSGKGRGSIAQEKPNSTGSSRASLRLRGSSRGDEL